MGNIALKFNNGSPLIRHNPSGDAVLVSELGLHTEYELEALRAQLATVAEQQREACAQIPQHMAVDDGHWNDLHERILATPLVTGPAPISERERALVAALGGLMEVCPPCRNGCDPDDTTCATSMARAALAPYAEVKP